jgi:hypothetical protein
MAGGAAGRAIAGGAAGLAAAAGGPGFFCAWADELTLAAITKAPTTKAAKRTPTRSIVMAPVTLRLPAKLNARAQKSFAFAPGPSLLALRLCDAG